MQDQTFRAYRAHQIEGKVASRFDDLTLDDLSPGDVVIKTAYSGINYKDALAATGAGRIMKRFPMVVGIDVAGHVASSKDPRFKEGDAVLVVGAGIGEEHDGGYAEYCRVKSDWIVRLPAGMSLRETMAIGTAGFTAALGIHRMEENRQCPEHGPILVSGASGGVGSIAVDLLAGRGYEVVALTGKSGAEDYLKALGAARTLPREGLDLGSKPMEKAQWGGAIDNLGGEVLTYMTRTVKPFGNIASIGLAASHELHTTVMPFILRGVSLLGINSPYCPLEVRDRVWERLASDLKPRHLDLIAGSDVAFDALPGAFDDYLQAKVTGRRIVVVAGA